LRIRKGRGAGTKEDSIGKGIRERRAEKLRGEGLMTVDQREEKTQYCPSVGRKKRRRRAKIQGQVVKKKRGRSGGFVWRKGGGVLKEKETCSLTLRTPQRRGE